MKFPKEIFVKYEYPGDNDDPFLTAHVDAESAGEQGISVDAAIYVLSHRVKLVNKTKVCKP